jgi:hypothetical protein
VKVIRNEVYQVSGFPQSTNWKLTGKVTLYSNFMYVKNTYVRYVFMMHTFFFMIYNLNLNSILKIKCYTYSWQNKTVVLFVYGEQLQESLKSFHKK